MNTTEELPRAALPPLPPPGPTLSFAHWTQAVHRTILQYVPGATAGGTGKAVSITYRPGLEDKGPRTLGELADAAASTLTVRIIPERALWWVHFDGGAGRFVMPSLCVERHDDHTVRCVAETIAGFLDARQSTPAKRKASAVKAKAAPKNRQ